MGKGGSGRGEEESVRVCKASYDETVAEGRSKPITWLARVNLEVLQQSKVVPSMLHWTCQPVSNTKRRL